MMYSDAKQHNSEIHYNMDILTIDMIPLIEKEIDPYDMVSLVFLLYDVPITALERLTVYQRVSKDICSGGSNLLHDWARHSQTRTTWKRELVEALHTCQLYSIIRKIGLSVPSIKKYFEVTNESLLNPMKKLLYKLCENINIDNLHRLKKTLITYDIDVTDHETCEMLLLDLMCQRFITLCNNVTNVQNDIQNLAKIIDYFPGLQHFADEMRIIEHSLNKGNISENKLITSTPSQTVNDKDINEDNESNKYLKDLKETFDEFNKLQLDIPIDNIKSDRVLAKDMYEIKDPKNIGVCLIINQEKFHTSKHIIESKVLTKSLEDRNGSTKDKNVLMETMKGLNFEVVVRDNLDHTAMIDCIKDVIKYRVHEEHSMFMLCILSHGTKGHIYAADSVKIKVEDIENLLDSDDAVHLRDKPKLMILQACQVKDDNSVQAHLVADSPKPNYKYYIKKSDIIIYWATAPNYEAFRHEKMGSIFIQMLCYTIRNHSKKEHVNDLFTKVTCNVKTICVTIKREQLPKVEHTLAKKLYLQIPEANLL